jgi:ketosteroid isomerase-like protein
MLTHSGVAFLVLAALSVSGCQKVSTRIADADREAIHLMVDNFSKAVVAGDFATAVSYYTEDAMVLPPNAPIIQGRAAIQSLLVGFPKIVAFKQNIAELEANGDLAYARLTFNLTTTPPGAKSPINDTGKGIIILRKQINGTWLTTRSVFNSDLTGQTTVF